MLDDRLRITISMKQRQPSYIEISEGTSSEHVHANTCSMAFADESTRAGLYSYVRAAPHQRSADGSPARSKGVEDRTIVLPPTPRSVIAAGHIAGTAGGAGQVASKMPLKCL